MWFEGVCVCSNQGRSVILLQTKRNWFSTGWSLLQNWFCEGVLSVCCLKHFEFLSSNWEDITWVALKGTCHFVANRKHICFASGIGQYPLLYWNRQLLLSSHCYVYHDDISIDCCIGDATCGFLAFISCDIIIRVYWWPLVILLFFRRKPIRDVGIMRTQISGIVTAVELVDPWLACDCILCL